jgi:hypothetical protein
MFGSAVVIGGTIFVVIMIVFSSGLKIAQTSCLYSALDSTIDSWGEKKNTDMAVFRQQAEAAARINIKLAGEGKKFLCPSGNVMGKLESARRFAFSSTKFWKSSERDVVLNTIARNAMNEWYEFPWPAQYECANSYAGSQPRRAWASVSNGIARMFGKGEKRRRVGQIGTNFFIYCSG